MVQDSKENQKKCICPGCPSYPKKCRPEVLYCSKGSSNCDIDAQGCSCPGCLVYAENNLKDNYFCAKENVGEAKSYIRKIKLEESKSFFQSIVDIKDVAATGKSITVSMGSQKNLPFSLDDLHFVSAQISKIPLNREEKVVTAVVIGPAARRPLKISSPIMISGMSFGATARNVKLIIAQVAKDLKIGFNSGEGGILDSEFNAKDLLIGQYATGRFGVDEKILKKVAAVEIRFGQGAYPGKGSYLPANKITPEIAKLRGLKGAEAAYSPAHHHDIKNLSQLKEKVNYLRKITGGVPIGAKISCGNVEEDIEVLIKAGVDYIAIDGFGGGTGATDKFVRENVGIPIWAALPRAYHLLENAKVKNKISLIAGGGLRTSADFAKCLALGADAIYIGTAALIAINCQQFRICHTGLCPTGVTTQAPMLARQLNVDEGARKLSNFIKISIEEIATFARIVGKNNINDFSASDLVALKKELAIICQVKYLDGNSY